MSAIRGPRRVDALSESKRRLLERRLQGIRPVETPRRESAIPLRPSASPKEISLGQVGIFAAHEADPLSPALNISSSFGVAGRLDVDLLERAVAAVAERHEILRSCYRLTDEGIEVSVVTGRRMPIARHTSAGESEALAEATRIVRQPFDLAADTLVRLHYFAVAEGNDLIVLVVHHIVFDEWSLGVFWREVAAFYRGARSPEAVGESEGERGSERVVQYSDFSAWQREMLAPESEVGAFAVQRDYWREKLRDPPPPLALPTDRPYPERLTNTGHLERHLLSDELATRLRALAASEDSSLFTLLLLGFQLLLSRCTDTTDIVVASPVANRRVRETTDLIGFFLSTVPLRARIDDRATVRSALRCARTEVLEALEHQDIPFDRVVDAVRPPRVAGRHPLCQVMFVHERAQDGAAEIDLGDAMLRHRYIDTGTAKYDLTLFVSESGERIETAIEYRADLFDAPTVQRFARRYEHILSELVERPDQPLAGVEIATPAERRALLDGWQGEPIPEDGEVTVVERFSMQVVARADAPAVLSRSVAWSYRRLGEEADRVARRLIEAGVEAGDNVALLIDRSPRAIAALVGVLRAGAGYVPLDPEYPAARMAQVIADSGIRAALTTDALADLVSGEVECVVRLSEASSDRGTAVLDPSATDPDGPAYTIYTSGSTGNPKGVAVSHRNLACSTAARAAYYGDPPGRFLLIPSLAFDSSVAGLFWTLTEGASLVVASASEQRDPNLLAELIRECEVTDLLCIPSLYRELLLQSDGRLDSLRRAIVAGESCPRELVDLHYETVPEAQLFNEYGPTEATVWSTVHRCSPEEPQGPVSIGRPIPGARAHVLDRAHRPLPAGIPGELFVGGPGVVAGYRNDERKSRAKFRRLVLGGRRERLYATGDVARWRDDGTLDYLGRTDDQIKLRGHRIELGEVEAALRLHPAVLDAAAVARRVGQTTRLIAFVVLAPGATNAERDVEAVRQGLGRVLPEYAVPGSLVALEDLPRLPNGKVDRAALPDPDPASRRRQPGAGPTNRVERQLLEIWEGVLGREGIGVEENFFDLGGDSLMSIQISSRARSIGLGIEPALLLQRPTIAGLAELMADATSGAPLNNLVPIHVRPGRPNAFCVHAGGGHILFYRGFGEVLGPRYSVYGLQPVGIDGREKPLRRIEEIAKRYLAEIRVVQPEGKLNLLGYCWGATVVFEMAQQLRRAGEPEPNVVLVDSSAPRASRSLLERAKCELKVRTSFRRRHLARWLAPAEERGQLDMLILQGYCEDAFRLYTPEAYPGPLLFMQGSDSKDWDRSYWDKGLLEDWLEIAPKLAVERFDCTHEEFFLPSHVERTAEVVADYFKHRTS